MTGPVHRLNPRALSLMTWSPLTYKWETIPGLQKTEWAWNLGLNWKRPISDYVKEIYYSTNKNTKLWRLFIYLSSTNRNLVLAFQSFHCYLCDFWGAIFHTSNEFSLGKWESVYSLHSLSMAFNPMPCVQHTYSKPLLVSRQLNGQLLFLAKRSEWGTSSN